MPSPTTERRTLAELVDALHRAGLVPHDDALPGAELLVGWEGAVVRTRDGWIYRFSRLEPAAYAREVAVLRYLDGRLPVPSPRVERVAPEHLVIGYRTITGSQLDLARVNGLTPGDREPLARSLAELLAAMHACAGAGALQECGVPVVDYATQANRVRTAGSTMQEDRTVVDRLLAAWDDCSLSRPVADPVLMHGDFHPGNLVFGSPIGPVTGVWDFSCVALGDPADDFHYLLGDSPPLAAEMAAHYTGLTGRRVDLEAARLVGLLEDVLDAIEEDRALPQTVRTWADG